jgi:hypothetical protein
MEPHAVRERAAARKLTLVEVAQLPERQIVARANLQHDVRIDDCESFRVVVGD